MELVETAMVKQCVILVGGLGARLGDIVQQVPKPMLEVAGVPFVIHLIRVLSDFGFKHFLLLAGYRAEAVEAFFFSPGNAIPAGLTVRVLTEPAPLGTAGALKAAGEHLDDSFLLCNGDSYCNFDIAPLCTPFQHPESLCRMALRPIPHNSRYGAVTVESGMITGFWERSDDSDSGLMNTGVYFMHKNLISTIPPGASSLEADIFPALASLKKMESLVLPPSFFIDIGIPEDLEKARELFSRASTPSALTEAGLNP